ncbi:MAG: hypothetical protein RI958_2743 [Actinomycetota bacterium]
MGGMSELITKSQAAVRYRIGKGTLNDLLKSGRLTPSQGRDRLGKPIDLIDTSQLESLGYASKASDELFLEEKVELIRTELGAVRSQLDDLAAALAALSSQLASQNRPAGRPVETSPQATSLLALLRLICHQVVRLFRQGASLLHRH